MNEECEFIETIHKYGTDMGVRIPASIAKAVHFAAGQQIMLRIHDGGVLLCRIERPTKTLSQRLKEFDPKKHGGEVLAFSPRGSEII